MKIVAFKFMGNQRICIMDNGVGLDSNHIEGDSIIGSIVSETNGKYKVIGAGSTECET